MKRILEFEGADVYIENIQNNLFNEEEYNYRYLIEEGHIKIREHHCKKINEDSAYEVGFQEGIKNIKQAEAQTKKSSPSTDINYEDKYHKIRALLYKKREDAKESKDYAKFFYMQEINEEVEKI